LRDWGILSILYHKTKWGKKSARKPLLTPLLFFPPEEKIQSTCSFCFFLGRELFFLGVEFYIPVLVVNIFLRIWLAVNKRCNDNRLVAQIVDL